jgi:hypothetical protein
VESEGIGTPYGASAWRIILDIDEFREHVRRASCIDPARPSRIERGRGVGANGRRRGREFLKSDRVLVNWEKQQNEAVHRLRAAAAHARPQPFAAKPEPGRSSLTVGRAGTQVELRPDAGARCNLLAQDELIGSRLTFAPDWANLPGGNGLMDILELERRYRELSTARLVAMTSVERGDYTPAAIEVAERELERRQSAPAIRSQRAPDTDLLPFIADASSPGTKLGGMVLLPGVFYYLQFHEDEAARPLGKRPLAGLAVAVVAGGMAGADHAFGPTDRQNGERDRLERWLEERGLLVRGDSLPQTCDRLDAYCRGTDPCGTQVDTARSLFRLRIQVGPGVTVAMSHPRTISMVDGTATHSFVLGENLATSGVVEAFIGAGFRVTLAP